MHSTSIITKQNNTVNNIKNISGTIGVINDKDDYEGYTLAHEIINNKKLKNIKEYDNYIELLNDLLNDKIKYAFGSKRDGLGYEVIVPTVRPLFLNPAFKKVVKRQRMVGRIVPIKQNFEDKVGSGSYSEFCKSSCFLEQ